MSHYIPVFFLSINDDECPKNLGDWHSAVAFLPDKWSDRERNGFLQSASRNWWHQHAIMLICEGLQISGLDFLQYEIACLDQIQIQVANSAIDEVSWLANMAFQNFRQRWKKKGQSGFCEIILKAMR